jgi:hypothetical protein
MQRGGPQGRHGLDLLGISFTLHEQISPLAYGRNGDAAPPRPGLPGLPA